MRMQSDLRAVLKPYSTLATHTKPKTRKDCNRLAIGSYLVCLKFAKTVYFPSCVCGRRKKEEKRRKKEDEQNQNFQVWLFQTC